MGCDNMVNRSFLNVSLLDITRKLMLVSLLVVGQLFTPPAGICQEKRITNDLGMTFIWVAPGSFYMGSPDAEPFRDANEVRHKQEIKKGFYLQETEVTLGQWRRFMGKSFFDRRPGGDDIPATRVSFYDCEKFIRKLNKTFMGGYRLPTEAEWEYACRAGTQTAYSWGNDITCDKAMYANSRKNVADCQTYYKSAGIPENGPADVRSFPPNPWGFYDMHGNVWEWCSDEYRDYMRYESNRGYDAIDAAYRIRRGGSWYKYPQYLRSANRAYAHPSAKFKTTGFRLVFEAN